MGNWTCCTPRKPPFFPSIPFLIHYLPQIYAHFLLYKGDNVQELKQIIEIALRNYLNLENPLEGYQLTIPSESQETNVSIFSKVIFLKYRLTIVPYSKIKNTFIYISGYKSQYEVKIYTQGFFTVFFWMA